MKLRPCKCYRYGEGPFDFAKCKARFNRGDIVEPGQLVFDEPLVRGEIRDNDPQKVVPHACHQIAICARNLPRDENRQIGLFNRGRFTAASVSRWYDLS